jgi:DNA-binding NarL/FixJ family response regulator/HAMP domain-containing protein
MSFQGMIEDVAVADVMQLIRLGGHSGTLTVRSGQEEGFIGFERGHIVSAWNPRSRRLGELLVAAGEIDEGMLISALETQNTERPRRNIGQILVRAGATTPEAIRDVMAREIERVVGEIFAWKTGTFVFTIDDLTPLVEVTRFTGAPKVELDTQTVLMDVLRRMEEGDITPPSAPSILPEGPGTVENQVFHSTELEVPVFDPLPRAREAVEAGAPSVSTTGEHPAVPVREPTPMPEADRMRFQIVSPDSELVAKLNALMSATGDRMVAVGLRDAGASLLGESPPIVVVDLRYQVHALATLSALCRSRPRASVIALFEGRAPLREMYKSGVLSVTSVSPETIVACMQSVARQRRYMVNEHAITEGIRTSFARLRRIIADLRSGLLGTSVSSNLMAAVAESLDRGILFVPHLDRLVALGAFGNTGRGAPLSKTTQGLILALGTSGVFKDCVSDSRFRRMQYDQAGLPQAFLEAVDRPRTGEMAVLPVPGSERVIAAIYLDNGARDRAIGDIEIFELAAFQLGLALENEFLRRAHPKEDVANSILSMRKTG